MAQLVKPVAKTLAPVWSSALDSLPVAALMIHQHGEVGGCSGQWLRLTKLGSDCIRKSWTSFLSFKPRLENGFQQMTLISGDRFGLTFVSKVEAIPDSGGWFWVTIPQASPVQEEPAGPASELGRLSSSVQQLLHNFPNGTVSILDPDLRFLYIDGQSLKKHHIAPSTMIGKELREILMPEEYAFVLPYYQRALQGETLEFEFTFREKYHYLFSCMPLYGHDGNLAGITVLNREISYLKQQETRIRELSDVLSQSVDARTKELSESKIRFNMLAESVPAFIWLDSPNGVRNYTNNAWSEFFGASQSEIPGNQWMERIHPDDLSTYILAIEEARISKSAFEWEYRLLKEDGEYAWFWGKATPHFDEQGTFLGMIGAEMNIQPVKDIETKLKHASRALESNHDELVELSYILYQEIEHELREISRYHNVLKGEIGQGGDRSIEQTVLRQADGKIAKMLGLIEDSTRFARINSTAVKHKQTDLARMARGILTLLEAELNDQSEARFVAPDQLLVSTDPALLHIMIASLLKNCLKYRHPDRDLEIELGVRQVANRQVFFLSDNGLGIHPREASLLFDFFYSGHTRSGHQHGVGLGLTIAKRVIKQLGGDIWAEGREEEGLTIYFSLEE